MATNTLDARPPHQAPLHHSFVESLARTAHLTLLALLGLAGVLLLVRRLSGALPEPLPMLTLLPVGVFLASAVLLTRRMLANNGDLSRWRLPLWCAASVTLLLWMLALTLPGTHPLGLVLFCGVILLAEGWSWGRLRAEAVSTLPPTVPSSLRESSEIAAGAPAIETAFVPPQAPVLTPDLERRLETLAEEDHAESDPAYDETVSQQIVRRRDESGEVLTGWTRVDFAQAQRVAAAHIAICPPLERGLTCEAEQQDGPAAEVKVTQAMPYGVRLEVKLDEPAEEPTSVVVEFAIQAE